MELKTQANVLNSIWGKLEEKKYYNSNGSII